VVEMEKRVDLVSGVLAGHPLSLFFCFCWWLPPGGGRFPLGSECLFVDILIKLPDKFVGAQTIFRVLSANGQARTADCTRADRGWQGLAGM
jgi:hypothetical protein